MTSSSFSEETLLTLIHAATLQPPIALPPEASFWKDSPAQQVQATDSCDGQAVLA